MPVVDMADKLFQSLKQRDEAMKFRMYELLQEDVIDFPMGLIDELQIEMDNIKILCIATHVMEMTRRRNNEDKQLLAEYCDAIMRKKLGEKKKKKGEIDLQDYTKQNLDLLSVRKVCNIQFKEDDNSSELFLKELYAKCS